MKKTIIFSIIFFAAGMIAGYIMFSLLGAADMLTSVPKGQLADLHPIRLNNSSYKFINPLLIYVIPSAEEDPKWAALKNKILKVVSDSQRQGLEKVSIFLSDLNQGRWIGVNENEAYPPASMFKVVVMIAYLKGEEQKPGLLNQKLAYTSKNAAATVDGLTTLKAGEEYTVSELIDKMIIDSDNGAEMVLLSRMDRDFFDNFFATLGIEGFQKNTFNLQVSPRQYSLFFRIIYNATLLSARSSEQALHILAQAKYKDGIVAGVPSDIVVAHKFGQYTVEGKNNLQLHDCGIVYFPEHPYFLCVMTKGKNLTESASVIKNISALVYQNYQEYE